MYESIQEEKKQAGTLKNIGNTYRTIKSYDKAHAFFRLARSKFEKIADSTGMSNVLNDIGIMYMDQDSNLLVISYFDEVLIHNEKHAVKEVKAYALNNIAVMYSKIGKYPSAYQYYYTSLSVMRLLNEQYGTALVLINLGDLFIH